FPRIWRNRGLRTWSRTLCTPFCPSWLVPLEVGGNFAGDQAQEPPGQGVPTCTEVEAGGRPPGEWARVVGRVPVVASLPGLHKAGDLVPPPGPLQRGGPVGAGLKEFLVG